MCASEDQSGAFAFLAAAIAVSKSPDMTRAWSLRIQYQQTIVAIRSSVSSASNAVSSNRASLDVEKCAVRPPMFSMNRCWLPMASTPTCHHRRRDHGRGAHPVQTMSRVTNSPPDLLRCAQFYREADMELTHLEGSKQSLISWTRRAAGSAAKSARERLRTGHFEKQLRCPAIGNDHSGKDDKEQRCGGPNADYMVPIPFAGSAPCGPPRKIRRFLGSNLRVFAGTLVLSPMCS